MNYQYIEHFHFSFTDTPLLRLSPEHIPHQPPGHPSRHGLGGAQPGPGVAKEIRAVEAEREAAEDQPLEGHPAK